jgi:hypothetical protein
MIIFLNLKICNMKKTLASFLSLFSFVLVMSFITGCDKDDNNTPTADMYNISATMNAAQETTPNTSTGTGTTTGTYNATTNTLQYNVTWTGLTGTATLGHFHGPALAGANASPVITFNLVNNASAGTAAGTITLTDAQEADLIAGKWYTNIHTAANTGGEIRGQVTLTHQ